MKIAIYSRKSKFTGKGESIENQIEMCFDYIRKNLPDVSDDNITVYEDEGFSAKNLDRPQFKQMMIDLEKIKFDYIVVYRLDRISRNVGDFSGLVEELNKKNVSFICIKEQFDTSTPMGRAMMYIASVFAQLERETIAERVRDNMYQLAKTGRWLGGNTPLGYSSHKITYNDDGKLRSYFVLKPDENADMVKLIFAKYLELQSATKLVSYLINNNIQTINNCDFSRVAIRDIVDNPCYCQVTQRSYDYFKDLGCQMCFDMCDVDSDEYSFAVYGRKPTTSDGKQDIHNPPTSWIVSLGKHQPLVSADDWLRVQDIRKVNTNKTFYRKVHNKNSLLSGLIYCKQCGHKMRPRLNSRPKNDGTVVFYYMCEYKDKTRRERCQMKNVNGLVLDKLVIDAVLNYNTSGTMIYEQLQSIKNNLHKNTNYHDDEIINLDKQIEIIQSNIKNLMSTLMKSSSDDAIYNYVKVEITEQDAKLKQLQLQKSELAHNNGIVKDYQEQYDFIKNTLSSFKKSFDYLTVEQKREYLRLVISRIEWDGETADIFIYGTA